MRGHFVQINSEVISSDIVMRKDWLSSGESSKPGVQVWQLASVIDAPTLSHNAGEYAAADMC